jgi:hypothetical protein
VLVGANEISVWIYFWSSLPKPAPFKSVSMNFTNRLYPQTDKP